MYTYCNASNSCAYKLNYIHYCTCMYGYPIYTYIHAHSKAWHAYLTLSKSLSFVESYDCVLQALQVLLSNPWPVIYLGGITTGLCNYLQVPRETIHTNINNYRILRMQSSEHSTQSFVLLHLSYIYTHTYIHTYTYTYMQCYSVSFVESSYIRNTYIHTYIHATHTYMHSISFKSVCFSLPFQTIPDQQHYWIYVTKYL